jgi:hypothetical protein
VKTVQTWQDIPAVPTTAFKEAVLATAPARQVFVTSGTTQGNQKRGKHHLPELCLYEASWGEPFRRHVIPDREAIRILSLIPGPDVLPESSLSFMVGRIVQKYGGAGSGFFLDDRGLRFADLEEVLAEAEKDPDPVLILGTALAMAKWLDERGEALRRFTLPSGSRIMDTGGFKGRSPGATRAELLQDFDSHLGIPPTHVVGEYGMTELCSQFYETGLSRVLAGEKTDLHRVYEGPPWTRTLVLNPETLIPVAQGLPGLLAHWDLANAWTVSAVVTEDLGVMEGQGFRLLGRAEGAELRGCSLATEELVRGT